MKRFQTKFLKLLQNTFWSLDEHMLISVCGKTERVYFHTWNHSIRLYLHSKKYCSFGSGGGQAVFFSDDPSSNSAEANSFSGKKLCLKRTKINERKGRATLGRVWAI